MNQVLGQSRLLKTVLLEARVFWGLAPIVPLSAESGKNGKGLLLYPKKQSPPKKPPQAAGASMRHPPGLSRVFTPSPHDSRALWLPPAGVNAYCMYFT
uniref:Uncharacterized protein n=1 Tax=Ursus americanus TaxID=9643 RepID=A0A452QMM1_URSAM